MPTILTVCNDIDYFLRHRVYVANRILECGHRFTLICGGRHIENKAFLKFDLHQTNIDRFRASPLKDAVFLYSYAKKHLETKPKSVHLITLKPAIYCGITTIILKKFTPHTKRILITIPGLGRLLSPDSNLNSFQAQIARTICLMALKTLGRKPYVHFTFETEHDRNVLREKGIVHDSNSSVLNGAGVNSGIYYPAKTKHSRKTIKILFASRLLRSKGIEAFVMAAESSAYRDQVEYVIAGIEDERDPDSYPAENLRKSDAITYLGEVTDMASLLRSVDIVCLPTLYGEGIPRILIEAAASGLPAITTSNAGCAVITHHLQNGIVIPVGDVGSIADEINCAISSYVHNPQMMALHGENAKAVFGAGGFDEKEIGNQFLELLLVDNKSSQS